MTRSVSAPRTREDTATLSLRQRNGLDAVVHLLQRRRHVHDRRELAEWRRQFAEVVDLMRSQDADPRTPGTR